MTQEEQQKIFEKMWEYFNSPEGIEKLQKALQDYVNKNFCHINDLKLGDKVIFEIKSK